jgi:hypothetical protein
MPAADTEETRTGLPLVPGLLWSGVGLAPIAALLVLFAGNSAGLMRLAVLLAVIAVGLIGVSLALRRDPDSMRDQIEDMVFEELDVLRDDVREDITTAARATHKAFGERVVTLQESVASLRGEFESLRVRVEHGGVPARPAPAPVPSAPAPPPRRAPAPGVVPPVAAPHGVVRHTETVKVTTRQTIVDQNDSLNTTGTVYGAAGNGAPESPVVPSQRRPERAPAPARGANADTGESWTEQLMRQRLADGRRAGGDRRDEARYGDARYGETRYGDDRSGPEGWTGDVRGRQRAMEPEDDHSGRITGAQSGDRWTSVRSDDRGREVRMGERRAAMHTDDSGTELRVEDRWAAVRRDEVRRPETHREPEREWDRGRDPDTDWSREAPREREAGRERAARPEGFRSESHGEESGSWSAPPRDRRGAQPALPATPSEPSASSWMQGWDGHDEEAPPARSARARSAGHDTGQEHWR